MGFDKAKLKISMASFRDATALKNALALALKGNGLKLPDSVESEGLEVDTLIDSMMSVIADDKIMDTLFQCSKKALYNDNKVDEDFFDKSEENRELYFPIMIEVIKKNVGPFVKGLLSSFGEVGGKLKNFLK
jgi:hypothetical protein